MLPASHRPKPILAIWFGIAMLVMTTAGCVNFESETMLFVFPPNSAEVRGLLIYEGLGISGTGADDLKKAKEQLTRLARSQQEFCLGGNWLCHVRMDPEENDLPDTQRSKALLRAPRHSKRCAVSQRNGEVMRLSDDYDSRFQQVRGGPECVDFCRGHADCRFEAD